MKLTTCCFLTVFSILLLFVHTFTGQITITTQFAPPRRVQLAFTSNNATHDWTFIKTANQFKTEPILEKCSDFQAYVDLHGYSISSCNGRLGNQLGVVALGRTKCDEILLTRVDQNFVSYNFYT